MVVDLDTAVAVATVLGAKRTHRLARVADVEDRVSEVPVIPPGSGITNLKRGEGSQQASKQTSKHKIKNKTTNTKTKTNKQTLGAVSPGWCVLPF